MSPLARRIERARHAWDDWTPEDVAEELGGKMFHVVVRTPDGRVLDPNA